MATLPLKKRLLWIIILIVAFPSCQVLHFDPIQPHFPQVASSPPPSSPFPFPPLTEEEKSSFWGMERDLGLHFAFQHDFYRAITSWKRALFFLPPHSMDRQREIAYYIVLSYFQNKHYDDALAICEQYRLFDLSVAFPAIKDFVIILHECYREIGQEEQAHKLIDWSSSLFPQKTINMQLSYHIRKAHFNKTREITGSIEEKKYIPTLFSQYEKEKKSPHAAQLFNALLPGAGYFYVGQQKSGLTALTLNSLFITACCQAFKKGHTGLGLILASFEMGWYFGGIHGGGLAAQQYNQRLYENYGHKVLQQEKLYPLLLLEYRF